MTHVRAVGLILSLVVVLAWSATPAQAAPTSSAQHPAQLSTAAALFVKVDPATGTDTILVFNRQQVDGVTTTGSAISLRVRFYDSECTLRFDNDVPLTPQGFAAALASSLFGVSVPGVMLADFSDADATNPTKNSKFAVSGVVVDGTFGAIYEHIGLPLLQGSPNGDVFGGHLGLFTGVPSINEDGDKATTALPMVRWGGFSDQDIDDWFIGGFTMLQMICAGPPEFDDEEHVPPGFLTSDLNELAALGGKSSDKFTETFFGNFFPQVNVYDAKEVLKRSIHNVDCFCNTDSQYFGKDSRFKGYAGDFADILVSMKAVVLGTFHWDDPNGAVVGWRVIGDGKGVYWGPTYLRTTPGSALHIVDEFGSVRPLTP